MKKHSSNIKVRIRGKMACFTNPATNPECYSYPVPTLPSLTSILSNIYWKPEMEYHVNGVHVINKIEYGNSIKFKETPLQSSVGMITITPLINVDYIIDCAIGIVSLDESMITTEEDALISNLNKHYGILIRRIEKGQEYKMPFFGKSQFPVEDISAVNEIPKSHYDNVTVPFGAMHAGMIKPPYNKENNVQDPIGKKIFKNVIMENGFIDFNKSKEGEVSCIF